LFCVSIPSRVARFLCSFGIMICSSYPSSATSHLPAMPSPKLKKTQRCCLLNSRLINRSDMSYGRRVQ
jgi:hypothetical protein